MRDPVIYPQEDELLDKSDKPEKRNTNQKKPARVCRYQFWSEYKAHDRCNDKDVDQLNV